MKSRKILPLLLAAAMLMIAAVPAFASDKSGSVSAPFSEGGPDALQIGAPSIYASANQSGVATIESDPSRLSAPGYVTVTIKLRNTNTSSNSNSIGTVSERFAAPGEDSVMLLPPVNTVPPKITPEPEQTGEPVTPVPTTDPFDPVRPTQTPGFTNPPVVTPVPQSGRYTHVSVTNPYGVAFQTSDVNPGSIGVFRASMMIYDSMIGQSLSFVISWYDTAANMTFSQTLALMIQRSDTAYLRMTRTVNVTGAAMGEEVEFTYSLVNTGSRRLNDIRVVDDKIAGNTEIVEPFSLASGERRDITYTYTMKGASVVSKPVATFIPEGSSSTLSVTVSKITIGLINAQVTKSVNIGTQTPEGVTFTLFMTNNGSQNLSNLTVKDDLGTVLAEGFSLAIGESRIIEHFIPNPDGVRNVVFYVSGTYDEGKEFEDNTESYTVRPYINPALLGLKFRAEVRRQLDSENNIGLTFTVENTGRLAYTNLVLTEEQLGYTIHEIHGLAAASEPVSFDVDLKLDEPRELVFVLTALDPSGNEHTFDARINAQNIDVDPAIPNVTPPNNSDTSTDIVDLDLDKQISEAGQRLNRTFNTIKIIFILILAVIAVLAALEYYLYRRRKNQASSEQ